MSLGLEKIGPLPRRLAAAGWIGLLAGAGIWTFFFLKHDRVLGCIIPFSRDPFDAIGAFAVISAVPLWLLTVLRTFTTAKGPQSGLLRAQLALLLVLAVMWLCDLVAMAAH